MKNKTIAIYGDSLSTYEGWVPEDALFYYPIYSQDVKNVEKTWWQLLIKKIGLKLHANISYSGSTVCGDQTSCGISDVRLSKLVINGNTPDIIIILLGINDVCCGHEINEFKRTYKEMLSKMRKLCPNTDIFINNLHYETASDGTGNAPESYIHIGLRDDYNKVFKEIAQEEYLTLIDLDSIITKETDSFGNKINVGDNIHFNAKGMETVCDAAYAVLKEFYK